MLVFFHNSLALFRPFSISSLMMYDYHPCGTVSALKSTLRATWCISPHFYVYVFGGFTAGAYTLDASRVYSTNASSVFRVHAICASYLQFVHTSLERILYDAFLNMMQLAKQYICRLLGFLKPLKGMLALPAVHSFIQSVTYFSYFTMAWLSRLDMDLMSYYCGTVTVILFMFMLPICSRLDDSYSAGSLGRHPSFHTGFIGGAPPMVYTWQELLPYLDASSLNDHEVYNDESTFTYHSHVLTLHASGVIAKYPALIAASVPVSTLSLKLSAAQLLEVGKCHGLVIDRRNHLDAQRLALNSHRCDVCSHVTSLFRTTRRQVMAVEAKDRKSVLNRARPARMYGPTMPISNNGASLSQSSDATVINTQSSALTAVDSYVTPASDLTFPPQQLTSERKAAIISRFCKAFSAENIEETGCAVCGQLILVAESTPLSNCQNLDLLASSPDATRQTRHRSTDPILAVDGPVLAKGCNSVCSDCEQSLKSSKIPMFSLTNYMWLGDVPPELQGLSYAEQILVARVRHNRCVVRVQSGAHKMAANAISYANPMPDVYDVLPPPLSDLDSVLAFIFTGPCHPMEKDLRRTPLLVRRNKVKLALEWLKLNHMSYADLIISYENLQEYPDSGCPLVFTFRQTSDPQPAEALADNDDGEEDGTSNGPCSFTVHGLVGEDMETKSWATLKTAAIKHLTDNDKILAVGHAEYPESIYHNTYLYPQMFPWLFPYGKGSFDQAAHAGVISTTAHKRWMLMYHDKRFQLDPHFALIAMNHEQIMRSVSASFLTARRRNFPNIAARLVNLDVDVLEELSRKMEAGTPIGDQTEQEKLCFTVLHELDLVAYRVQGSATSKAYMRNEIWALIEFLGAPSWFITFSPADVMHPLCLYFADTKTEFKPEIRMSDVRRRLIADNPVAGARFFHFMVQTFLQCVLGVDGSEVGLFGKTSAYYGTVEQQGRMTLHLHLLLWIYASMTPREIRDKLMSKDGEFQKRMVEYLEGSHQGEFISGSHQDVMHNVSERESLPNYVNPIGELPAGPPEKCVHEFSEDCNDCSSHETWWRQYESTVDDILLKSNMHICRLNRCFPAGGSCKARFPRDTFSCTMMDPETGALNMKKGEPHMNTFSYVMAFLFRCNHDVTSLLSGTALKAVVAYVTEYVTKSGLKTYQMFDIIKSVFDRNDKMHGGNFDRQENARKLMTQVVNALTSKLEMGGPMAAMYLIGNPDHYTGHSFVRCYWKSYTRWVMRQWVPAEELEVQEDCDLDPDRVLLRKKDSKYIEYSVVDDYIYRPVEFADVPLYTWMRLIEKKPLSARKQLNNAAAEKATLAGRDFSDERDVARELFADSSDSDEEDAVELPLLQASSIGRFIGKHPDKNTHTVSMVHDNNTRVPMFLGGPLPRHDRGDREDYCMTMLTLFKPWRTGLDLKSAESSWSDTFASHAFSEYVQEKMKFFNTKYECLDAKDDFRAQRKAANQGVSFDWMQAGGGGYAPTHAFDDDDLPENSVQMEQFLSADVEKSTLELRHDRDVDSIKALMMASGWMDSCVGGLPQVDKNPVAPMVNYTSQQWQAVVKAKREEVIAAKRRDIPMAETISNEQGNLRHNVVEIVDQTWMNKSYRAAEQNDQDMIDRLVVDNELNTEQERVFRIVTNHATTKNPGRLQLYLGGMGGTGKSQVLKTLDHFFTLRHESHRLVVVAPTGTSASVVDGSTYHFVFGINGFIEGQYHNLRNDAATQARLTGADYVFIDESSLLSCRDLYKISVSACRALKCPDKPFGGLNLIFAGDFAQLPPVNGSPLYSRSVGTQKKHKTSLADQEDALGKALWHLTTTVVMLTQNMRQKGQSKDDDKLRTALENMRYKACTDDDITYLKTRVAGRGPGVPRLAHKNFRNVPVITAHNLQKDHINLLGAARFAKETGQKITSFYSIDRFRGGAADKTTKALRASNRHIADGTRFSDRIPSVQQEIIWSLEPKYTNHKAGRLDLCVGMPVMLRSNEATECCMTNGASAVVVGWKADGDLDLRPSLDILFVRLTNPARDVQLPGLPLNVVPIGKRSDPIDITLLNGNKVRITRQQVPMLLNFAITDYGAQGQNRMYNPVDLRNCSNYRAFYVALSRSVTSEGLIILSDFTENAHKIQGGMEGWTRQEYRELELLNEITRLKYEGLLPASVNGHRRNVLIRQYQHLVGVSVAPKNIHNAVAWSKDAPMKMLQHVEDDAWHIIGSSDQSSSNAKVSTKKAFVERVYVPALGSAHLQPVQTLKRMADTVDDSRPSKKRKVQPNAASEWPVGFKQDNTNFSCAYDAMFVIMHSLWLEREALWKPLFRKINNPMTKLSDCLQRHTKGIVSLESVRNNVRTVLHGQEALAFPYGVAGCHINDLALALTIARSSQVATTRCTRCNHIVCSKVAATYLVDPDSEICQTTEACVNAHFSKVVPEGCSRCHADANVVIKCDDTPDLLLVALPTVEITISPSVSVKHLRRNRKLHIRGVIYFLDFHFTARVVKLDGTVLYYDGKSPDGKPVVDGNVVRLASTGWGIREGAVAVMVLYSK